MKKKTEKKIKYSDEPLELEAVDDFLPPPEDLILKEDTVKVTIQLSKSSIEFFKKNAKAQHTKYQTMIRRVLDLYTRKYG